MLSYQRSRRRGRLKAPNITQQAISLDCSALSSPHSHSQVFRVLDTMARICTSADIIRREEEGDLHSIPTATLHRASALSKSVWEEILVLPLSDIPLLQKPLTVYEFILVDIQQILNSNDPLEISNVTGNTIDRRLDDFMVEFQEALDLLEGTVSQRSSPNSTHFFQNAHDIIIAGGNFSTNPVIHDPVVREQSHKILQLVYIQFGVLFV